MSQNVVVVAYLLQSESMESKLKPSISPVSFPGTQAISSIFEDALMVWLVNWMTRSCFYGLADEIGCQGQNSIRKRSFVYSRSVFVEWKSSRR